MSLPTKPPAILLVNLGTPDAPTPAALRRYLREFLSDPRVVEVPRLLWWLVLNLIILPLRSRRSAKAYASIWTAEGSPLLANSLAQQRALQQALAHTFPDAPPPVVLAMRYGQPAIPAAMDTLMQQGHRQVLVVPLYPQYSATTTGSVTDAVNHWLRQQRDQPALRWVRDYHRDPGYIAALADTIRASWQEHGQPQKTLFSFHGIPQRYVQAGDPYASECEATSRLLAEALGLAADKWMMTFQSRFGREPWLQPYTDHVLKALGEQGLGSVGVVCPGFSVDCLETLEEIAVENRHYYEAAGGRGYRYIPALNASSVHIRMLHDLVVRELSGWLPPADGQ